VLAAVIEDVELVGMKVEPRFPVAGEGIVLPGIPKTRDDIGEFLRPVVAIGVGIVLVAIEVQRLRLAAGSDEVPTSAAGDRRFRSR
jgi:hypothetical protein